MSLEDPLRSNCEDAITKLYAVIDRELGGADVALIEAHLAECAPCLDEYELERLIKRVVQRSCHEQAPADLRSRVITSIRSVEITVTESGPDAR